MDLNHLSSFKNTLEETFSPEWAKMSNLTCPFVILSGKNQVVFRYLYQVDLLNPTCLFSKIYLLHFLIHRKRIVGFRLTQPEPHYSSNHRII